LTKKIAILTALLAIALTLAVLGGGWKWGGKASPTAGWAWGEDNVLVDTSTPAELTTGAAATDEPG
jgi:hypothetical protein